MPLLRVQRYSAPYVVDYFTTVASFDASGLFGPQTFTLDLDPSLFPYKGEYAVIRTTGAITNLASPIATASWTSAHPSGYSILSVTTGARNIGGTTYNCILVTVG